MILFNGNQLSHQLIQHFAARAAQEGSVIVTVAYATIARLFSFILPSPTLFHTILSYLILPIHLHIRSHSFFIFLSNTLIYFYDIITGRQEVSTRTMEDDPLRPT